MSADRHLRWIRALRAKTVANGATSGEARAAATLADRLERKLARDGHDAVHPAGVEVSDAIELDYPRRSWTIHRPTGSAGMLVLSLWLLGPIIGVLEVVYWLTRLLPPRARAFGDALRFYAPKPAANSTLSDSPAWFERDLD